MLTCGRFLEGTGKRAVFREILGMKSGFFLKTLERSTCLEMSSLAPTVCSILGIRLPGGCTGLPVNEVVNGAGKQQRLCLVVIDTFGTYLWKLHHEVTPFLNGMAEGHSVLLQSDSPPYTPVNIATMATGAPFSRHGVRKSQDIVKDETILDVMAKCALKTAVIAREKSSLATLLSRKATLPLLDEGQSDEGLFRSAKACMKDLRPEFIWIHLLDLDNASHRYGPAGSESRDAIARIDSRIAGLSDFWDRYYYTALIVADHGQHANPLQGEALKGTHDGSDERDFPVPLIWRGWAGMPQ